jgi:hypothetical protein
MKGEKAMVSMNLQTGQQASKTPQQKARAARLKAVRDNMTVPSIKVYATTPEGHAVLRHPKGARFRGEFGTGADWPHDAFTQRRLLDGSVSTSAGKAPAKPDPTIGPRQAAYAMRPDPASVPPIRPVSAHEQHEQHEQHEHHEHEQHASQQRRGAAAPKSEPAA